MEMKWNDHDSLRGWFHNSLAPEGDKLLLHHPWAVIDDPTPADVYQIWMDLKVTLKVHRDIAFWIDSILLHLNGSFFVLLKFDHRRRCGFVYFWTAFARCAQSAQSVGSHFSRPRGNIKPIDCPERIKCSSVSLAGIDPHELRLRQVINLHEPPTA